MKTLVFVAAAMSIGAPALAQQSSTGTGTAARSSGSTPESSPQTGASAAGERRICRQVESTASRMPSRRVCMTAPEWRAYDRSIAN